MRRIKVTVKAVRHSVISRKSIRKRLPKYLFQDIFFFTSCAEFVFNYSKNKFVEIVKIVV